MLMLDLCHFLCFVLDEYLNDMKTRMTLKSAMKIKMNMKMNFKQKTHTILCFQTATKSYFNNKKTVSTCVCSFRLHRVLFCAV
ncbi:hypothetical protein Hanom_Chr15g01380221 [Helianthus anomalus]